MYYCSAVKCDNEIVFMFCFFLNPYHLEIRTKTVYVKGGIKIL